MATVKTGMRVDAFSRFYGNAGGEIVHGDALDFSKMLAGASLSLLSSSEKEAVEVLNGLLGQDVVIGKKVEVSAPTLKTEALSTPAPAKCIQVSPRATGLLITSLKKGDHVSMKQDIKEENTKSLKRKLVETVINAEVSTKVEETSTKPAKAMKKEDIIDDDSASDTSEDRKDSSSTGGGKSRYSTFRKASSCPYCKEIGLNCGKVAAKCPNRPCNQCGRRHRLNRCRKIGCKHCPGDHLSSKCPIKIKEWARASLERRRAKRQNEAKSDK